mgnify:CR=1 FL=1
MQGKNSSSTLSLLKVRQQRGVIVPPSELVINRRSVFWEEASFRNIETIKVSYQGTNAHMPRSQGAFLRLAHTTGFVRRQREPKNHLA